MYTNTTSTILVSYSPTGNMGLMFGGMVMEIDQCSPWVRLEGQYTEYSLKYLYPSISITWGNVKAP